MDRVLPTAIAIAIATEVGMDVGAVRRQLNARVMG